ncbi:hypothetical protein [Mycobacterium sp. GA-2829]|uniref:hypothetical protein n=1 Tax=Mycobacterium sp. GA-2829 TaxID=1772283 RepID=UPI0007401099|nr:hypothetical protein [Mycobacterium sp. GA-2829]KUI27326.1 hypothetical protein AU194_10180 [Mycobacterium sp. GA-2829]
MYNIYGPPSVRAIRSALEEVPGAIRDEPLPEDARGGEDPATEVPLWAPEDALLETEAGNAPLESDPDEGVTDEPSVVFEVPPSVTDADIRNVLGEDRIEELRQLHQIRGTDALGWYVTFHQRRYQHGVYIPVEGVLWLVLHAFQRVELPVERRIELAFHAILRHELFHFEVDCMTANWELTTGVDVYWNARGFLNGSGYIEQEEALANAYMLRGFKHPTRSLANSVGTYAALRRFCERQPPVYDHGPKVAKTRGSYLLECSWLADMYHQVSKTSWHVPHELDTLIFYPNPVRIDWTRCPIIVDDPVHLLQRLGIGISLFRAVEDVEETPKFQSALSKLDPKLQKQWLKRKADLARSTALKSLDFKQWKKAGPNVYSVRVDGNYRAHLRHDRDEQVWFAEAIGNHKKMKHG